MTMQNDCGRPDISTSLRALMAEVGPRWAENIPGHVKLMIEEFSKVHVSCPSDGSTVTLDIPYGPHPRQQFDLFMPKSACMNLPLLIFVHGGAFVDGHRNRTPQVYSNVLRYFARHGFAGINMGYRLAPECVYPSASQDLASVVRWAHDNAAKFNMDANRIFLMGHSAGAAHAASYAYDHRLHGNADTGLAGLVVISGRVRADTLSENPNAKKVETYYGTNPSLLDDRSPVSHVDVRSLPTFIAMAQFENPLIDVHCVELVHRLASAKRRSPPFVWLRGHNHTSAIAHINTSEDVLGRAILDFMAHPL